MEFLAGLYTLLLVAICLLQALLLHRTGKPAAQQDDEALKEWLRQQLEAQARVLEEKQAQQQSGAASAKVRRRSSRHRGSSSIAKKFMCVSPWACRAGAEQEKIPVNDRNRHFACKLW